MKPINPEKERIIILISQLLERSGLTIDQVVARMQVDGCEITRSTFENRFTTRVHQKPNIPEVWFLPLLRAFTQNLTTQERCEAAEALELAKLARFPLDQFPAIHKLFPHLEFTLALEKQFPLSYFSIDKIPTYTVELLTDNVNLRPVIVEQKTENHPDAYDKSMGNGAPAVSAFVGRQKELATIAYYFQDPVCHIIGIMGMGGMGKTVLAAKAAHDQRASFVHYYWRSLHNAPPLAELLADSLSCLLQQPLAALPPTLEKRLALFFQQMRQHRCLVVLDNFDALLDEGKNAGRYRTGFEEYGYFLRQFADMEHQSSIMLTSRERPPEFAVQQGAGQPIRVLTLSALDVATAQAIVVGKQLLGSEQAWQRLVAAYSGNPLSLKLAADSIAELFGGNIEHFLDGGVTLLQEIRELLDDHFSRLALLEREILYWLGIGREVTSLQVLQRNFARPTLQPQLLAALTMLRRRSLIEQHQEGFALQNVVLDYITERIIELAVAEVEAEMPLFLASFTLLELQRPEHRRITQVHCLLLPILQRLRARYEYVEVEAKLRNMVRALQAVPVPPDTYCAGNLINLLAQLTNDLRHTDFSHLHIRQADLRNVALQDVNFAQTTFDSVAFLEPFGSISTVAFSPDGVLLAAGVTNGDIHIWPLDPDQPPLKLHGHSDMIWSIAFHPNGQWLASSGEDQTIRIWAVATGECLLHIHAHSEWIKCIAFAHSGAQLASGGHDALVRLWDPQTGAPLANWIAHAGWIWALAFSPDDRLLATAGQDRLVKLWDVATGACLRVLAGHTDAVRTVAFDPTGARLVTGSFDHTLKLWDVASGLCLQTLTGHENLVWSVAFNRAGSLLASSSDDQSVRIWDAGSGALRTRLRAHHNRVWSLAFHPTQDLLATGGDDQTLRFWNVKTGRLIRNLEGYANQVWSVAYSHDGHLLASGGDDRIVRLWQDNSQVPIALYQGHRERIRAVAFSPDQKLLASGSDDYTVRLWDIKRNVCRHTLTGHTNRVWTVAFSPDGALLASASEDQTVRLWDSETGQALRTLRETPGRVWSIAFHPYGKLVAGGADANEVLLWDSESGDCLYKLAGHQGRIWSVAFSPDGALLASGGADRTVRLFAMPSGHPRFILEGHQDAVWTVAFSPDGQWLASAGDDQTICLWDVQTGALVHTLRGHKGCIWSVAFDGHGQLASGGQDETIRLWQVEQGHALRQLRSERPYERMNISGVVGLTEAQKAALRALGAVERE